MKMAKRESCARMDRIKKPAGGADGRGMGEGVKGEFENDL